MKRFKNYFLALVLLPLFAIAQVGPGGGGASNYNPAAVAITGGTVNGTAIGGTTPAAVAGTTVSATGTLTVTPSWNNGSTTFTAVIVNPSDTASSATSKLLDLQDGGTSKVSVNKFGQINLLPGVYPYTATGGGIYSGGFKLLETAGNSTALYQYSTGNPTITLSNTNVNFGSSSALTWSTTTDPNTGSDIFLLRQAAGQIAQRNGSNAQGFRVANTYTDANNNEFGTFDFQTSANVLTIGTTKVGTGATRGINFSIGSATAWQIDTSSNLLPAVSTLNIGSSTTRVATAYTSVLSVSAPVTYTGSTYTVAATDSNIIANASAGSTITLPSAGGANTGRIIRIKTIAAFTVISASSNVVPQATATAGTAILAATAGKWAELVSDGTNWVIMESN